MYLLIFIEQLNKKFKFFNKNSIKFTKEKSNMIYLFLLALVYKLKFLFYQVILSPLIKFNNINLH